MDEYIDLKAVCSYYRISMRNVRYMIRNHMLVPDYTDPLTRKYMFLKTKIENTYAEEKAGGDKDD